MANPDTPTIDILHLCGGIGSRMGAGINKVLLPFADSTVLEFGVRSWLHAAAVLQQEHPTWSQALRKLYLVGREEELAAPLQRLQNPQSSTDTPLQIAQRILPGADSRQGSVLSALRQLSLLPDPPEWVLIHDAARPGLVPRVLYRLLKAFHQASCPTPILPVLPVSDTLRIIDSSGYCVQTLPRERCVRVQTPQLLPFAELLRLHERASKNPEGVTDDAELFLQNQETIQTVQGDPALEKLTKPEDFSYLELVLLHKSSPETCTGHFTE